MAKEKKKAAAASEKAATPNESKGGAGRKLCPSCQAKGKTNCYVVGAARSECPECGHKFETKKKGAAKSTASGTDLDMQAMEFVLFHQKGNLDSAIKAVEAYKQDSIAQFVAACGGVSAASAKLGELLKKKVAAE